MRTIKIEVQVNDNEYELLRMGKCEQPNPQRMKIMLLSQAASNVRRMSEMVMQGLRGPLHPSEQERLHRDHMARMQDKAKRLAKEKSIKWKTIKDTGALERAKRAAKSNHSDQSWMDDDNVDKLKS